MDILDSQIASVSVEGFVEAIMLGETVITATCGEVSATCEITVIEDASIENLFSDTDCFIDIYTASGIMIKKKAKPEDLKSLDKGIYIVKSKGKSYKVNLK